ncbi:hypothetical protein HanPI659440_Chr02g0088031 [Helianthus annuus]|nr:hypothetical protein HanPI659440_Chr02g0088031 [Helianthus annuus]
MTLTLHINTSGHDFGLVVLLPKRSPIYELLTFDLILPCNFPQNRKIFLFSKMS